MSALAALLLISQGAVADADLQLEVIINGRDTGLVGEFRQRDGQLFATRAELLALNIRVPPGVASDGDDRVPLAALPGLVTVLDSRAQRVSLTAEERALQPVVIGASGVSYDRSISRAEWGALLNYDVLAQQVERSQFAGGLFEARVFGPYGVISSGLLGYAGAIGDTAPLVRLDTTYTWADPDRLERVRLGDFISSSLAWTRPLRLGGVQIGTDFGLRPDLVTFPTPVLRGSVAVGSTVDLLVNGVRQYSSPVPPGPFEFRQPPLVTGAGEAAVVVRDALGRETVQRLSFYASRALLAPGLTEYSAQIGAIRRNFGVSSSAYGEAAAIGTVRYGLSEWVTLEGHAETGVGTLSAGAGLSMQLGALGVGSMALASSTGEGGSGQLVSLSWERVARPLTFAASATSATSGYRDVAGAADGVATRRSVRASVGLSLGTFGNLGVAFVDQRLGRSAAQRRRGIVDLTGQPTQTSAMLSGVSILSATWSRQITERAFIYGTAFQSLAERSNYGVMVGVAFTLGPRSSVAVNTTRDAAQDGASIQYQQNATAPGDWGWRVQLERERAKREAVELAYQGQWGRVTGGVDRVNDSISGRVGLRGALSTLGGGVFISDRIQDAFAVVRAGGVKDVPVFLENRQAGRTDAAGRRLVPDLRAYEPNILALDPSAVPLDADTGALRQRVTPPAGSGIIIDFDIRRGTAARVLLVEHDGRPVPAGSDILLVGPGIRAPVGHDGETYLSGLTAVNRAVVTRPDASQCNLRFGFTPVAGDMPTLGPLTCR